MMVPSGNAQLIQFLALLGFNQWNRKAYPRNSSISFNAEKFSK